MKVLQQIFGGFIEFISFDDTTATQERNEAYLAEATDLYDLEYRIRKLDRSGS